MKQLEATYIPETIVSLEEIKKYCLGHEEPLECINWQEFTYKPVVTFILGWNSRGLYLFFDVQEQEIKAGEMELNSMVCNDSCVEMFISPKSDSHYYNFEFNAIGTYRVGDKNPAKGLKRKCSPQELSRVQVETSLPHKPVHQREGGKWSLSASIGAGFFSERPLVKGAVYRANFYKCGDTLKEPHYVSWNPVNTEKPSFHEPAFFGEVKLG